MRGRPVILGGYVPRAMRQNQSHCKGEGKGQIQEWNRGECGVLTIHKRYGEGFGVGFAGAFFFRYCVKKGISLFCYTS